MLPHYIDHMKRKGGKLWDSKRDNRKCRCHSRGKGRKPIRPKGAPTLSDISLALTLDILCLFNNQEV